MRPMCSAMVRCFDKKTITPVKINSGDNHVKSRDKNSAASEVPMSAPSMIASAGAVAISPLPANDVVRRAVAVELCSRLVTPSPASIAMKRLSTLTDKNRRSSAPYTRKMLVRTKYVPHTRSAIPERILSRVSMVMSALSAAAAKEGERDQTVRLSSR